MQTPPPASLAAQLTRVHGVTTVAAAYAEQKIELRLSDHPQLSRRVLRLLPSHVARDVADDVLAHRELARLTPPRPLSAFRVGVAAAASKLRAYYAEAQRRSSVPWQVLAAVNYVESDFGRMRESSVAGAQGPMQFMPSTWESYGRGDVHDPRAAILAAGRFLRAAGAPSDERGALYRYNPSSAYVDAVERFAGRIRRDPKAFLVFYDRRLIVRTPSGYRRLNEALVIHNRPRPGLPGAYFVTRTRPGGARKR
jgi:soluble lytic murein transglycosylase-like protein